MTDAESDAYWHPAARIGFRFAVIYFALYGLFVELPFLDVLTPAFTGDSPPMNGTGDSSFQYWQVVVVAGTAGMGAIFWSIFEERKSHPKIAEWTVVALRYWLALQMFRYGFGKVFPSQMPPPSLSTLMETYGQSSPMRLAWTFMGLSPGYRIFAGLAECLAGALVCWRRTTTLGALVGAGAMANVVAINFGFDVPVKQFSSHLLLGFLVLIALDRRRLWAALVGDGRVEARQFPPHFETRRNQRIGWAAKAVIVTGMTVVSVWVAASQAQHWATARSPLMGVYEVVYLAEDDVERPGTIDDPTRWRYLIFEFESMLTVQTMDGEFEYLRVRVDPDGQTLTIHGDELRYEWLGPDDLAIEGVGLEMLLERRDTDFLLTGRGFHWVNEYPLNR